MHAHEDLHNPPSQRRTTADAVEHPTLDEVYEDRNLLVQLVAALAQRQGMRVGEGLDPAEPDWPVVYIDLPTGQVSWHIPQREIVVALERYPGEWDGHSVEEKQQRVRAFLAQIPDEG